MNCTVVFRNIQGVIWKQLTAKSMEYAIIDVQNLTYGMLVPEAWEDDDAC